MSPLTLGTGCLLLIVAAIVAARWGRPTSARVTFALCVVVRDQAEHMEAIFAELVRLSAILGPALEKTLVIDVASTDGTAELLQPLARRYPGVRVGHWSLGDPGPLELAAEWAGTHWLLVLHAEGDAALRELRALQRAPVFGLERTGGDD